MIRTDKIRVATVLLAIGGLTLGGCGGSSSPVASASLAGSSSHVASSTPGQVAHPARVVGGAVLPEYASAAMQRRPSRGLLGSARNVHNGDQRPHRARLTPSDEPAVRVSGPNPCKLVSQAEVRAIAGSPVAGTSEAPLGPTCIYRFGRSAPEITVAVESLSFEMARRQLRAPGKMTIAGHPGYCGKLGRPTLYVSVAGGRVLQVTAPCPVARRIAAAAIGRITA